MKTIITLILFLFLLNVKGGIDDINDIDDKEFNINYKMIMKLSNIEYMKNLLSNISDPTNELFTNEDKFLSKEKIDIISKPNYESMNSLKPNYYDFFIFWMNYIFLTYEK